MEGIDIHEAFFSAVILKEVQNTTKSCMLVLHFAWALPIDMALFVTPIVHLKSTLLDLRRDQWDIGDNAAQTEATAGARPAA